MSKKNLTRKEISETFKKIKEQENEIQRFSYPTNNKDGYENLLEQKDVWIASDSSTSLTNFNQ